MIRNIFCKYWRDALFLGGMMGLGGWLVSTTMKSLHSFRTTQWMFSVKDGFYSRALAGTAMHILMPQSRGDLRLITTISLTIVSLLSLALIIVCYRYWKTEKSRDRLLVCLVFLTSPGTIQYFANDMGRHDQIGYLLAIPTAYIIKRWSRRSALFLLAIVSVILITVHEVMLVLVVPLLASVFLIANVRKETTFWKLLLQVFLAVLPSAIYALFVLTKLRIEYDPIVFSTAMKSLQEISNFHILDRSLLVQFSSLDDNFSAIKDHLLNYRRMLDAFFAFLVLLPSGIIGYSCFRTASSKFAGGIAIKGKSLENTLITFLMFVPLSACFIGVDYPRWMAVNLTNFFLIGMVFPEFRDKSGKNFRHLILPVVIILFSLAVGPVTATGAPAVVGSIHQFFPTPRTGILTRQLAAVIGLIVFSASLYWILTSGFVNRRLKGAIFFLSRGIPSLLILTAAAAMFALSAFGPEVHLGAGASRDYDEWDEFWRSEIIPAELKIPEENIPCVLPGPLDAWGGNKPREVILSFEIEPGNYQLRLLNYDAHEAAPPMITFKLNDKEISKKQLPRGRGLPPPYMYDNPKLAISMPLPIVESQNTLHIRTISGSWVAPSKILIEGRKHFALSNMSRSFIVNPMLLSLSIALFVLLAIIQKVRFLPPNDNGNDL